MPKEEKKYCGIIMPISEIDGCSASHWQDVRSILDEVIGEAGFIPRMVSDGEPTGIIHNRIVQNLYDDPIVVCDVSCRNPNVMFELGMRLTFDKPTVIIKDDQTNYAFDASPIEHIPYRRDLRYTSIEIFKEQLKNKIEKTYKAKIDDPCYSTFLKHFGKFTVVKPETVEMGANEYILSELKVLGTQMRAIYSQLPQTHSSSNRPSDSKIMLKNLADYITENEEADVVDCIRFQMKNDLDIDLEHLRNKLTVACGDTVQIKAVVEDGEEQLYIILPKTHITSDVHLSKILNDEIGKIKKKK